MVRETHAPLPAYSRTAPDRFARRDRRFSNRLSQLRIPGMPRQRAWKGYSDDQSRPTYQYTRAPNPVRYKDEVYPYVKPYVASRPYVFGGNQEARLNAMKNDRMQYVWQLKQRYGRAPAPRQIAGSRIAGWMVRKRDQWSERVNQARNRVVASTGMRA